MADAQPTQFSGEISKLLGAQQEGEEKIVGAEQKEITPAIDEAQKALNQPRPQAPQLQAAPTAPHFGKDFQESTDNFTRSSIMIAGLVGAFSRNHVTTALNAFGALGKGFRQGQVDGAKQAHDEWKDSSDEVLQNNNALLTEYQNALADRKATVDEITQKVQLIATKYKDPLMYQAATAKNMAMIAQLYERNLEATGRYEQAQDKLEQQWQEFQSKFEAQYGDMATFNKRVATASQVYARMFPPDPGTGRRTTTDTSGKTVPAPEFMKWFQNDWPKIQPQLDQAGATPAGAGGGDLGTKAKQALEAGIPRDQVKQAFIQDGGADADFEKQFPANEARQPLPPAQ